MSMSAENTLTTLGITLPVPSAPAASYTNAVRWGTLVYLSGKAPLPEGGSLPRGRLGREFTVDQGRLFARSAALDLIAVLRHELGSLDKVARIIELQGFVNATEDFTSHAAVLDGASDTFFEIFGPIGIHARSVLGASSLRSGIPLVLRAVVGTVD
ncbi:MAG: RidA family protein [Pseudomonadota bacterium]